MKSELIGHFLAVVGHHSYHWTHVINCHAVFWVVGILTSTTRSSRITLDMHNIEHA